MSFSEDAIRKARMNLEDAVAEALDAGIPRDDLLETVNTAIYNWDLENEAS